MKKKIITADGSFSVFDSVLNETYHSINGALTESLHVYINSGLLFWKNKMKKQSNFCNIFEMGFGTGLNALLAKRFSDQKKFKVNFFSIEKFPLSSSLYNSIKPIDVSLSEEKIFKAPWNKKFLISKFFTITKIKGDYLDFNYRKSFDIVFYDPFGYNTQPNLWSKKALKISFDLLNKGGVWVSYCSKGKVRRDLLELGMKVHRLDGPPGKREIIRAIKV